MYRGFQLCNFNFDNLDFFLKKGEELLSNYSPVVKNPLKDYAHGNDGIIEGTMLESDWFPQVKCDVFISHSHKDEKLAKSLAGWLYYNFELTSFIDSCIWGYADDLLRGIDDTYCWQPESCTYNYNQRNYSTSHVHMMLNVALMKMIDKTECLFFLNTPHSIPLSGIKNRTLSPWIYSEMCMSTMIEKRQPKRLKTFSANESAELQKAAKTDLKIEYELNSSHLFKLTADNLNLWMSCKKKKTEALDWLYAKYPMFRPSEQIRNL